MPIKGIDKIAARVDAKLKKLGTRFTVRNKGACYGFFGDISNTKIPQSLVDQVDTIIIVDRNVDIKTDDYIIYNKEKFKVVQVDPVRPDGTMLMYQVYLRS